MKFLRVFLKPGWVIAAVAVVLFAYVAFTVLAPWQLGKNARTAERNHNIEQAFERDPIPYIQAVGANPASPESPEWTRVTLHGHYLPQHEVVLRMRPVNSQPAFQALTPFELDAQDGAAAAGTVVLINRGYSDVATMPAAPTTPVTITGFLRADEEAPRNTPIEVDGVQQVSGIHTPEIAALTGLDLAPLYVQLAQDQPGEVTALPLPKLESGPYLSYGIQWIAFGIMAPLGLGYFIWAEIKERRLEKAEREQALAAATTSATSSAGSNGGQDAGYTPHNGKTGYTPHNGKTGYTPHNGETGYTPHNGKTGYTPHNGETGNTPHNGETRNTTHNGETTHTDDPAGSSPTTITSAQSADAAETAENTDAAALQQQRAAALRKRYGSRVDHYRKIAEDNQERF